MTQHQARKRFGQHFLVDDTITQQLIDLIVPKPIEHFVEIGPGLAALTQYLLPCVKQLDVVEIDRDLVAQLNKQFASEQHLTIHQGDALQFNLAQLNPKPKQLRIVGNLPYNIATPLLFHLLAQRQWIHDMHFMLQHEVAERLTATPNTASYGRLTVMIQYYCYVDILLHVPARAFSPKPKVESAFVHCKPHTTLPFAAKDEGLLAKIVQTAFNQRRKTLSNSLKPFITSHELAAINIDPQLRAEALKISDFVQISHVIYQKNCV